MLLNDWLTQCLVIFLKLQLRFMSFENLSRDHRNPLALLDCTVWANHLSNVWSWKQLRSRALFAQIWLVAALCSTQKPSKILWSLHVSLECCLVYGVHRSCMASSLPVLPRTTAESPHQKRGFYYGGQGKSWRSCTFADSVYKINIYSNI